MELRIRLVFAILLCTPQVSLLAQENNPQKSVYSIDFNNFKSSFRQEIGFSFISHFARSPIVAEYNLVSSGVSYPQPVYNNVFGVFALTYEPKFRLIEAGSSFSFSLDLPLTGGFSVVDLTTPDGVSYSSEEVTPNDISTGVFSKERSSNLGLMNAEFGALISFNFFQGSTIENINALGLTFSGGVNYISAPLAMNFIDEYQRSDYKGFLNWTSVVGRLGVHAGRVVFYYTIGINPTRALYYTALGNERTVYTNTYNRFSISFRLGR